MQAFLPTLATHIGSTKNFLSKTYESGQSEDNLDCTSAWCLYVLVVDLCLNFWSDSHGPFFFKIKKQQQQLIITIWWIFKKKNVKVSKISRLQMTIRKKIPLSINNYNTYASYNRTSLLYFILHCLTQTGQLQRWALQVRNKWHL